MTCRVTFSISFVIYFTSLLFALLFFSLYIFLSFFLLVSFPLPSLLFIAFFSLSVFHISDNSSPDSFCVWGWDLTPLERKTKTKIRDVSLSPSPILSFLFSSLLFSSLLFSSLLFSSLLFSSLLFYSLFSLFLFSSFLFFSYLLNSSFLFLINKES